MELSVVTVTYDSAACISKCLRSVRDRMPGAEIVVVDNASKDETLRLVADAAPDAKTVRNEANVGFGRACNAGARAATRSHVLFLNPDVIVTGFDDRALRRLLAQRPFGLAAPLLEWGSAEIYGAHAERHWLADYVDHTWQTVTPRGLRKSYRRANPGEPRWASGAMLVVDRQEFLGLGGFDERFFLYYEDRDLSARYRDAGLPIRTTDALRGVHIGGGSSRLDELRASSLAWSFLGWLQYLYVHDGERVAYRRAKVGLRTLRAIALALRAAHRVSPRYQVIARKQRQLSEVLAFLERQSLNGSGPEVDRFCPDARRLLTRAGR